MSLIPKFFLDSVVSIGERHGDDISWFGTGFFVARKLDSGRYAFFLVSNCHVFASVTGGRVPGDTGSITIRMRRATETSAELIPVEIIVWANGVKQYTEHPKYSNDASMSADVAALLLPAGAFEQIGIQMPAFDISEHALSSVELADSGGGEGSFVYMLGYPIGMVDIESNAPICRLGCIARSDEREIRRTNNMLLDIQNFPGNSGSPVVIKPEAISIEGTKALDKAMLVGIVHSYTSYNDELVSKQTGRTVEVRSENSGIAQCNPVEYIREVIELEANRYMKQHGLTEIK